MFPPDLFRRNLIGLLVVLGAAAVLYLTELGPALSSYRNIVTPRHSAPAGGGVEAHGLTWQVRSSRQLNALPGWRSEPVPAGTVARIVTIDRHGSGQDEPCVGVITDGSRRWTAQGIGTMVLPPTGTSSNCAAPGPVQFTFIVPRDVTPTAVDVLQYDNQIIARLAL